MNLLTPLQIIIPRTFKSSIFSFFAAFKNNELDYGEFYLNNNRDSIFSIVRRELSEPGSTFNANDHSIRRTISNNRVPKEPDVIMITLEEF